MKGYSHSNSVVQGHLSVLHICWKRVDGGFINLSSFWLLSAWKSHPLLPVWGTLTAGDNLSYLNHASLPMSPGWGFTFEIGIGL